MQGLRRPPGGPSSSVESQTVGPDLDLARRAHARRRRRVCPARGNDGRWRGERRVRLLGRGRDHRSLFRQVRARVQSGQCGQPAPGRPLHRPPGRDRRASLFGRVDTGRDHGARYRAASAVGGGRLCFAAAGRPDDRQRRHGLVLVRVAVPRSRLGRPRGRGAGACGGRERHAGRQREGWRRRALWNGIPEPHMDDRIRHATHWFPERLALRGLRERDRLLHGRAIRAARGGARTLRRPGLGR